MLCDRCVVVQLVLEVIEGEDVETPFPAFTADFNDNTVATFRFADVDRLFIRNMPVACLSMWLHAEVDLSNRRAFAQSDPVIKQLLLIVSAPIFLLIEPAQKTEFAQSLCQVCILLLTD